MHVQTTFRALALSRVDVQGTGGSPMGGPTLTLPWAFISLSLEMAGSSPTTYFKGNKL